MKYLTICRNVSETASLPTYDPAVNSSAKQLSETELTIDCRTCQMSYISRTGHAVTRTLLVPYSSIALHLGYGTFQMLNNPCTEHLDCGTFSKPYMSIDEHFGYRTLWLPNSSNTVHFHHWTVHRRYTQGAVYLWYSTIRLQKYSGNPNV